MKCIFSAQDRKHVFGYTFSLALGTNLTDYIRGVSEPFQCRLAPAQMKQHSIICVRVSLLKARLKPPDFFRIYYREIMETKSSIRYLVKIFVVADQQQPCYGNTFQSHCEKC